MTRKKKTTPAKSVVPSQAAAEEEWSEADEAELLKPPEPEPSPEPLPERAAPADGANHGIDHSRLPGKLRKFLSE